MSSCKNENLGAGITAVISGAHGFGTDAILLAHFAAPKKNDKACDLGAGCGIIPLLWCRDSRAARITAVEIQAGACEQVRRAVEINRLSGRIEIVNADLRELKGILPAGAFDLVTMNPPYKAKGAGRASKDEAGLIARHEVMCTLEEAAAAAAGLLKFGGRFCLCHRPERLCDVFAAMRAAGIEPKRLRMVAQKNGKAPWLILAEGRKGGKPGLIIEPQLTVENESGGYSEEMKSIYGDYQQNGTEDSSKTAGM